MSEKPIVDEQEILKSISVAKIQGYELSEIIFTARTIKLKFSHLERSFQSPTKLDIKTLEAESEGFEPWN